MKVDKNSMLYWFPKIKDFGIPIPRTEVVKVPWGNDYWKYIPSEDAKQIPNVIKKQLKVAGEKISYPLFMRTKHEWKQLKKPLCKKCAKFHRERDKLKQ